MVSLDGDFIVLHIDSDFPLAIAGHVQLVEQVSVWLVTEAGNVITELLWLNKNKNKIRKSN
jgi:hypothetical protein